MGEFTKTEKAARPAEYDYLASFCIVWTTKGLKEAHFCYDKALINVAKPSLKICPLRLLGICFTLLMDILLRNANFLSDFPTFLLPSLFLSLTEQGDAYRQTGCIHC